MTRLAYRFPALLLATFAFTTASFNTAQAAADLDRRVQSANEVLQDLRRIPEQAIPPNLLNRAYAVAVLPNVVKGGFFVGGSYGKGVLLVRQSDGSWSNPSFISLGSIFGGLQWGVQGADLVLVFKSRKGVDDIASGKFTLGGSASASAGPVGRTALAMTDGEFKAEIYTYARSRGLFVGVALDGGGITIDKVANMTWYGNATEGSANRIFTDRSLATPAAAESLRTTLTAMAPHLNWKDSAMASQASQPPAAAPAPQSKTYAVEDGAAPAPETKF